MLLEEPALRGLSLGSAEWFAVQQQLLRDKPLLKYCYDKWYDALLADERSVPADQAGKLLELGSGGSYLHERNRDVITSDVVPGLASCVIDGRSLPYADASLRAIFLTHALHHIPQVERFFAEAQRTLVPGGVVSMIEVARTPLAKLFFTHLHPEPFDDQATSWDFAQSHAMADANQALSWLAFVRDRQRFEAEFPQLVVEKINYLPWFSYLTSGGVTRRAMLPGQIGQKIALAVDALSEPARPLFALHWHITLRKKIN
jgi:SAM-dependent methyltransferase